MRAAAAASGTADAAVASVANSHAARWERLKCWLQQSFGQPSYALGLSGLGIRCNWDFLANLKDTFVEVRYLVFPLLCFSMLDGTF